MLLYTTATHHCCRIPVSSPLCLPATSCRSSRSCRNLSIPCVSTLLKPFKNPLHSRPTAPMVTLEAACHGLLGASDCSSGRIGSWREVRKTCAVSRQVAERHGTSLPKTRREIYDRGGGLVAWLCTWLWPRLTASGRRQLQSPQSDPDQGTCPSTVVVVVVVVKQRHQYRYSPCLATAARFTRLSICTTPYDHQSRP